MLVAISASFLARKQSSGRSVAGLVAMAMLLVGTDASMVSSSSPSVVRTLQALALASTFTMTSATLAVGADIEVFPNLHWWFNDKFGPIDGVFNTDDPYDDNCGRADYADEEYWSFTFAGTRTVEEVLFLTIEWTWVRPFIEGANISLGWNADPRVNALCASNMQGSGFFSCGGQSGNVLGVWKIDPNNKFGLAVCEIRAYSWKFNLADYELDFGNLMFGNPSLALDQTLPDPMFTTD